MFPHFFLQLGPIIEILYYLISELNGKGCHARVTIKYSLISSLGLLGLHLCRCRLYDVNLRAIERLTKSSDLWWIYAELATTNLL